VRRRDGTKEPAPLHAPRRRGHGSHIGGWRLRWRARRPAGPAHAIGAKPGRGSRLLVPVAVGALVVAVGTGAGVAYAGLGSTTKVAGHGTVGQPVRVTVTAANGPADLLPGGTGAAYFTLTNRNPFGASFDSVTDATVVSDDPAACPSQYVSIAPHLPYAISPPVSVGAKSTSGPQSIAGLVQLSASSPSGCQGVTFTATLTLSGTET
jgi:hypothetical protein